MGNNALQPTWEAQSEAIIVLHTHLLQIKKILKNLSKELQVQNLLFIMFLIDLLL